MSPLLESCAPLGTWTAHERRTSTTRRGTLQQNIPLSIARAPWEDWTTRERQNGTAGHEKISSKR
eukprot:4004423-Pyramimonas_sp.AAC.1